MGSCFHRILTSIQYNIGLDVAGFQCWQELGEQAGKSIIVASILPVQAVVKVEVEKETAAINNQTAVPELDIFEEASVRLHVGGETLDTHWFLGPGKSSKEVLLFLSVL